MLHSTTISLLLPLLFVLSSSISKSNIMVPIHSNSSVLNSPIFASLNYQQGSQQTIFAKENNRITSIDIYDNMIITMDLKIHQLYNGYSQSIFHIGNQKKNENYPAILLNKKAENGFKIRMTSNNNPIQLFKTYNRIDMDTNYHIEISYTQQSFSLYINDQQFISENDFAGHPLCANKTVYVGDPWHHPANAYISNLKIFGWNDVEFENDNTKQESTFSLFNFKKFYNKHLSGAWKWGIVTGCILLFNIAIIWYLNCSSFAKYKQAAKQLRPEIWNVTKNDIINLKIRNMQQEAAHEIEFSSDDDVVISYQQQKRK
eukprot:96978_1